MSKWNSTALTLKPFFISNHAKMCDIQFDMNWGFRDGAMQFHCCNIAIWAASAVNSKALNLLINHFWGWNHWNGLKRTWMLEKVVFLWLVLAQLQIYQKENKQFPYKIIWLQSFRSMWTIAFSFSFPQSLFSVWLTDPVFLCLTCPSHPISTCSHFGFGVQEIFCMKIPLMDPVPSNLIVRMLLGIFMTSYQLFQLFLKWRKCACRQ